MDSNNGALEWASLGINAINTGYGAYATAKNYENQERAFDYQKELNEEQYDYLRNKFLYTSYDLAQSGYNKASLLGQMPSNANLLSSAPAPQLEYDKVGNSLRNIPLDIAHLSNNAAQTDRERTTAKLQEKQAFTEVSRKLNIEADSLLKKAKTKLTDKEYEKVVEDINFVKLKVEELRYNIDKSKEMNLRTFDAVSSLFNTLQGAAGHLGSELLGYAVDVAMFFLPGLGFLKGANLLKNIKNLGPYLSKGKDWMIKNWNKIRKKIPDMPTSPSDFFG